MKTARIPGPAHLLLALVFSGITTLPAQEGLFPNIPGWSLTLDTTVYTPRNLWDLIDGAAEVFLSYGFVDCTLGEYVAPDGMDVRAEAYRHATPTLAFGIYAMERKPDYRFIDVGTQGYQEDGVVNFLSGEYYVKLSTHRPGKAADEPLLFIARQLAGHLNRPGLWPDGLRHLPETGRQANTEGYVAQNLLGYSFLGNAFTALYGEGTGFLLFLIEFPTATAADETVTRYRKKVPEASSRNGVVRLADPDNGPVTLVRRKNLLFGLVNPPGNTIEAQYINLINEQTK